MLENNGLKEGSDVTVGGRDGLEKLMEKIDRKSMDKLGVSPLRRSLKLPHLPKITNSLRFNKLVRNNDEENWLMLDDENGECRAEI